MNEKAILTSLKAIFLEKGRDGMDEKLMFREFATFEGKAGLLEAFINERGGTISNYLASTGQFINCGGGYWRGIVDENSKDIAASLSDRKKSGGSRQRSRGNNGGARGRGAPIQPRRTAFDNHRGNFGFRGNRGNRGNHTHGYTFHNHQPTTNRSFNPPQDFSNQVPLTRNNTAANHSNANRGGFNMNSSLNNEPVSNNQPSSYDRAQPRPHRSPSHSPVRSRHRSPSPYRPSARRSRSPVRDNQRDYGNDSRGYNDGPSDYHRDYEQRYDTGPSYSTRDRSPVRYRSSSSPRARYSPPPPRRDDRDVREPGFDNDRSTNYRSNNDYSRNQRIDPFPLRHRNEYPPRPDSGASSYSQNSVDSMDSSDALPTSSNSAQMDEIARRFNAVSISRPTPVLVTDEKVGKKAAKAIKNFMSLTSKQVLLEELENEVRKVTQLPNYSHEKMEQYIAELKIKFPDTLRFLEINADKSGYKWSSHFETSTPEDPTSFQEDSEKNELYYHITDFVRSISTSKFRLTEVVGRIAHETKAARNRVVSKLTYILFVENKGKYRYKDGDREVIVKTDVIDDVVHNADSYEFSAPLTHKIFNYPSHNRRVEIEISRFMRFERFGVRAVEYVDEYEQMDRRIQQMVENGEVEDTPVGGWKSGYGCLVRIKDPETLAKWVRGIVIRTETALSRVYLLDISHWVLLQELEMKVMPSEYRTVQPYSIACSLVATDDQFDDLYLVSWKEKFIDISKKMEIEIMDDYEMVDGIKVFSVNFYIETLAGGFKNIIE